MTDIDFAILNNHVTVLYFKIYQKHHFFVVKQKNLDKLCFPLLFILVYKMCLF